MLIRVEAPPSFDGSEGLLALIVSPDFDQGLSFKTEPDQQVQVATISHRAGHKVGAHVHLPVKRTVYFTTEVLHMRRGLVKVSFYTSDRTLVHVHMLTPGETLIQLCGGHSFEFIEDSELLEVKQGPYVPEEKDRWNHT